MARVKREIKDLRDRARSLTVADVEGDALLYGRIVSGLREAATLLEMRFKYLQTVPWNFSQADTPEGATLFLAGATSRPFEEQDELTRYLYYTYHEALQTVANGGVCETGLSEEVSVINASPLDESAGEGYHRSTHCTRLRARASKSPYIKQSTRLSQNYGHLKSLLAEGDAGKKVLRFEWRNWTRVLQTHPKKFWRPVRMNAKQVFERVYHMDAKAEENWSSVCAIVRPPGQGPIPKDLRVLECLDDAQQSVLRIEYLHAVLAPRQWYQIEIPVSGMDENGSAVERLELKHFQLLSMASTKSRPKLMPTIQSHQDPIVISKLALNIQETSTRSVPTVAEGSVVVYPDAEPRWINWGDLGPWNPVYRTLTYFQEIQGLEEHAGCLQLSGAQRAVPIHPVTDLRCPALLMLKALRRLGWAPKRNRIIHDSTVPGPMDGREAIRMKPYYVVLIEIERCLPLTTDIPSDQPILFYKLLLQGVNIEPNLGHAHYLAISRGTEIEAQPSVDAMNDDGWVLPGALVEAALETRSVAPGDDDDPRGLLRLEATPVVPRPPKRQRSKKSKAASSGSKSKPSSKSSPGARALSKSVGAPPVPPGPGPGPVSGSDDDAGFMLPASVPTAPPRKKTTGVTPKEERSDRLYVPAIGGGEVVFSEYVDKMSGKAYRNWIFKCNKCPKPEKCQRTMGLGPRNTARLGDIEPLVFLHVWRDTPPGPQGHRKTQPSSEAVTAFYEAHRQELEALHGLFATS